MSRSFSRAELESFRDAEVPDLLGGPDDPSVRLLFVGINPGLWTAATQTHFAHPGNRFYPALLRGGVITAPVDAAAGMGEEDRARFRARGIGITNLVRRATAKASELTTEELRAGGAARAERARDGREPRSGVRRGRPRRRAAVGAAVREALSRAGRRARWRRCAARSPRGR